jgi:hypothetical protein
MNVEGQSFFYNNMIYKPYMLIYDMGQVKYSRNDKGGNDYVKDG